MLVAPAVLVGLLWFGVADVLGQVRQDGERLDPTAELLVRPTEISPKSGPPGTEVTVRGLHLPAITPINIAFGGTRSGFEGLTFVLTTRGGEIEEILEIPEWADRDRIHRFIIFDAYFDPISMTDLFHVTDADGRILREVEVIEAGPTCALIVGADQDEYSIVGDTEGLAVGDALVVEARVVESSECGEHIHLEIIELDVRASP